MQRISAPFRIALVAILLLAGAWFAVLRPKAADQASAPAPLAPGVKGLSNGVKNARAATDAANAAIERAQRAAAEAESGTGGEPAATKAKPKPAVVVKAAPAAKPKPVAVNPKAKRVAKPAPRSPATGLVKALEDGKVVVLMFRSRSADSEAVADTAGRLSRRGGKVVVRVTSIGNVGRYAVFTRKTPVSQAPAVLVIGPSRRAKVIVGFTDTGELNQAVDDMLAAKARKPAKSKK